jgi:hypothetical protein
MTSFKTRTTVAADGRITVNVGKDWARITVLVTVETVVETSSAQSPGNRCDAGTTPRQHDDALSGSGETRPASLQFRDEPVVLLVRSDPKPHDKVAPPAG